MIQSNIFYLCNGKSSCKFMGRECCYVSKDGSCRHTLNPAFARNKLTTNPEKESRFIKMVGEDYINYWEVTE